MPYYLVKCYEGVPSENVNQIKEFVRGNGGEIQQDFESFNGFSAEFSEDLMARLKSHEDVESVEIDLFAPYQSPSSEEAPASPTLEDVVSLEKMRLIRHIDLETTRSREPSLFFIESAPNSTRGAKCRLPGCDRMIQPGDLRFAMYPGMDQGPWGRSNASLYHIVCFEKIADFSRVEFLDRLQPLTRNTFRYRGVKVGGILDGNYLVSGGVERLVLEWKVTHGKWADERDGLYDESEDRLPADFDSLLRQAGSAVYQGSKPPDGMDQFEYCNLLTTLAPNESEGPDDKSEWNLFKEYLDSSAQALNSPHDLSSMLQRWQNDVYLARVEEDRLNEVQLKAKHALGEKAIRALERLSSILMPNIQSSFF
ncbi:hypothetical protein N7491_006457 [Penicillium cf. griseofulvum]|uniref:Inhibitor I9 domain-containing protein n=1 Tax=Penicillium cf. griseofulvum TaxID=2972120 RepID=A0A9W9IWM6_9EURO|nr:hypothetical protein N7472_010513 [Penicillium cf. griseofulvum]KAJ5429441.1 hypothetical protein N7491_006457 [Penicillium cf. griseofulvum]